MKSRLCVVNRIFRDLNGFVFCDFLRDIGRIEEYDDDHRIEAEDDDYHRIEEYDDHRIEAEDNDHRIEEEDDHIIEEYDDDHRIYKDYEEERLERQLVDVSRVISRTILLNKLLRKSRFKAGRISIEDDPRQGRPKFQRTDENVQKITDLIKENPRTTLLELEQDTGISKTTIGRIVTEELKLKKTPAKFIPRFLTNEQKLCRLATCEDMMEMTRTDPEWKDKIITGDETWVYGYDPETKPQSAEWRALLVVAVASAPSALKRSKRQAYELPDGAELLVGSLRTTFQCPGDGFYADVDNNCQIFHVCHTAVHEDGSQETRQWSFLCGNQTMFNQFSLTCSFPEEAVPCSQAGDFFYINNNIGNPTAPLHTEQDFQRAAALYPLNAVQGSAGNFGKK
ncbi:hypothetical protein LAZ67_1008193 [Cordylochernes scorpioides]|uniref:Chitin-binding type-2 domain-containing protein n=1 Tax=Cordylochernes scorpioides TaxID=51811 RepID=A0ABY6K1K7_9ARAC|nr:hypothetical protein LAZ67_1008193 [Cordylochernes scorpioides]